jgi:hypothetical protein
VNRRRYIFGVISLSAIAGSAAAAGRWDLKPIQRKALPMTAISATAEDAAPEPPVRPELPAAAAPTAPAVSVAPPIRPRDALVFGCTAIGVYALLDRLWLRRG